MMKRIPRENPAKARTLPFFKREVEALLTVKGYSLASARAAVQQHAPIVKEGWKAGKAPCGTADRIHAVEKAAFRRGKARGMRDPDKWSRA